jgi:DNA-binding transcriptional LysR family regulator
MEPDRLLGVEIRHLAALQAVAEHGSFGRAAAGLGYTQSAVSQQIAMLERLVGERLVERPGGPRSVSLTQAGELLLRHAEAIVARLQAARADLAALASGRAGALRIGTFQSVGARIVPETLRRLRESWPLVDVALTESNDDETLVRQVERGELDLTFVTLPIVDGPFLTVELLSDPYVLLVPGSWPLASETREAILEDIAEVPLIGFRQCRGVMQIEAGLRAQGFEPRVVFRSDDNGTVQALVAAGIGCAIAPALAVDRNDETTAAIELRIPPRRIAIAWHRDRYRAPAARAFVETAREVCSEIALTLTPPAGAPEKRAPRTATRSV